jgi:hypothetical protein
MARPTPPAAPEIDESVWRSMPEEVEGGSFAPASGMPSRSETPITLVPAAPDFQLLHKNDRWTVFHGRVVPNFLKLKFIGGVAGVDQIVSDTGRITPRIGVALAKRQEEGKIAIPFDAIPRAHVGRADLHQTVGRPPSYLWKPKGRPDLALLIYERCHPGDTSITYDVKGYIEFCDNLVTTGVIPACPLFVLRKMLRKEETSFAEAELKFGSLPSYAPKLAQKRSIIEAIQTAISKREADENSRPGGRPVATGDTYSPGGV